MSYSIKRYSLGDLVWSSDCAKIGVVEAGVIMSFPDLDFNYEIGFPSGVRLSNEAFLHKSKRLAELYAKNQWQNIPIENLSSRYKMNI